MLRFIQKTKLNKKLLYKNVKMLTFFIQNDMLYSDYGLYNHGKWSISQDRYTSDE